MSSSKPAASMLWGGRFTGGFDPLMVSYNESMHFDRTISAQDIHDSIAYARANPRIGILTASKFEAIEKGFKQEIHTANERRLGENIGTNTVGKLHTSRSRNDQVATGVLSAPSIFPEKMKAALTPDILATDLADYLMRNGAPFRKTHHISGRVVALAKKERMAMYKLSMEQLQGVDGSFGDDILDCLDFERNSETRTCFGGMSRGSIEGQIKAMLEIVN